ncbi:hypothetical protein GGI21_001403 [Coemansia aciculifera]|nr:hypothetical protein GGI21_001403 [Coemansia aciculifera]
MAEIMLGDHTARFCVAGPAGASGAVNVMCVFERDHLALRIQSETDKLAFAAVGYSLAKRLCLLLDSAPCKDLAGGAEQSLLDLLSKYTGIIAAASQSQIGYGEANQRQAQSTTTRDLVDFVMVQGDWLEANAALFV